MNKSSYSENDEQKSSQRKSRELSGDAAAQLAKLRDAGSSIGDEVASYVKKQPLAAVGIAVGAGFVLGSIFGSRLGRLAMIAGVGYAAQTLINEALGEGGVRKLLVDEVSKLAKTEKTAS